MLKSLVIISALISAMIFSSVSYASSLEVIALKDVNGKSETSLLIGASESEVSKYFPDGKMPSQILAFLVRVGEQEILFDTGLSDGHISNEILKNNSKPENIKIILLTHLHMDHFGGLLTPEGEITFPNAEVYVSKIEYDYWVKDIKNESVIKTLKAYESKLHFFDFNDEVVSCVKAIDTSGHTPGHTSYLIDSGDEKLLIVGDVVHFMDIQLPNPEISVRYDVDPVKAAESRKFIFDYAAENNIRVAGMHMTFPSVYSLKKSAKGYEKFTR